MGAHAFIARLADRPFAIAMGLLLMFSALVGLTGTSISTDALATLVPVWLTKVLLVTYGLSGLLILGGIGLARPDVEAAGCILAATGATARLLALVLAFGPTVPVLINAGFFIAFGGACIVRFMQIVKGETIIRVNTSIRLGEDADG